MILIFFGGGGGEVFLRQYNWNERFAWGFVMIDGASGAMGAIIATFLPESAGS